MSGKTEVESLRARLGNDPTEPTCFRAGVTTTFSHAEKLND